MQFPFILLLFAFLTLIIGLAWWGKRRLSVILFVIFLVLVGLVLWHHMTNSLAIEF